MYTQEDTVGFASYHFISNDSCYISFANVPSTWPRLDNGKKLPQKKYFTNVSINENQRIFKGDINWQPTSWQGAVLWSFEMYFAEDYATIASGTLKAYYGINKKNLTMTYRFGVHLHYNRQRGTFFCLYSNN